MTKYKKVKDKIVQLVANNDTIYGLGKSGRVYYLNDYNKWIWETSTPFAIYEVEVKRKRKRKKKCKYCEQGNDWIDL